MNLNDLFTLKNIKIDQQITLGGMMIFKTEYFQITQWLVDNEVQYIFFCKHQNSFHYGLQFEELEHLIDKNKKLNNFR